MSRVEVVYHDNTIYVSSPSGTRGPWVGRVRACQAPRNPVLTAAIEQALAQPEEPIKKVAACFGLSRNTLTTALRRRGLFISCDPRRQGKACGRSIPEEFFLYAEANLSESVAALSERFKIGNDRLRRALCARVGTSHRAKPKPAILCRKCGETDPVKFSKATSSRSGYQHRCKACSHAAYLAGTGKGRTRRSF